MSVPMWSRFPLPFDPSGYTALSGATMMFELACMMAEAVDRARG